MSRVLQPSQMRNKDKFKALLKQVAVSAAMNAVPGTVHFIAEVGHKVYELWLSSTPEERESYRSGAEELSETECDLVIAELQRETGVAERLLVDVMVQSIQGMRGIEDEEALRSINAMLSRETNGQATLTPQRPIFRRSAIGTIISSWNRHVDVSGRVGWPKVKGFEIIGVLGKGASGVVYLAKETRGGGRICALKVGNLVSESRFQREVAAMGAVEHEHLIDLWGSGKLSDPPSRYWISMPNAGGLTLADLLNQGQLDLPEKLRLMSEVLSGLAALHSAGLVHRDLKPANVLVTPTLSVRLADFGLSKESVRTGEAKMTAINVGLEGTPAYMSPEQVNEVSSTGAEVDVWAFGIMLFEVLRGERPFRGQNIMRLGMEILTKPIELDPTYIPQELIPIIRKCLTRELSERYSNALNIVQSYQDSTQVVISRFMHNQQRNIWHTLEQEQAFIKYSTIQELKNSRQEFINLDEQQVHKSLKDILNCRTNIEALELSLQDTEQSLEALGLSQMSRSEEILHQVLNSESDLLSQWQTWHKELCRIEREVALKSILLEAQKAQVDGEQLLIRTLHSCLTTKGRSSYDNRVQASSHAYNELNTCKKKLNNKVQETLNRTPNVGSSRVAKFESLKTEGQIKGKQAAKLWLLELSISEKADQDSQTEKKHLAHKKLKLKISQWNNLPNQAVEHDEALISWHKLIENGSLVDFCLQHVLNIPDDPSIYFKEKYQVNPQRLGEVISVGMQASISTVLHREKLIRENRVILKAQQNLNDELQSRLPLFDGIKRLQNAGYSIGFEQGFRNEIKNLSTKLVSWNEQDLLKVNQALQSELKEDLIAYDTLIQNRSNHQYILKRKENALQEIDPYDITFFKWLILELIYTWNYFILPDILKSESIIYLLFSIMSTLCSLPLMHQLLFIPKHIIMIYNSFFLVLINQSDEWDVFRKNQDLDQKNLDDYQNKLVIRKYFIESYLESGKYLENCYSCLNRHNKIFCVCAIVSFCITVFLFNKFPLNKHVDSIFIASLVPSFIINFILYIPSVIERRDEDITTKKIVGSYQRSVESFKSFIEKKEMTLRKSIKYKNNGIQEIDAEQIFEDNICQLCLHEIDLEDLEDFGIDIKVEQSDHLDWCPGHYQQGNSHFQNAELKTLELDTSLLSKVRLC